MKMNDDQLNNNNSFIPVLTLFLVKLINTAEGGTAGEHELKMLIYN